MEAPEDELSGPEESVGLCAVLLFELEPDAVCNVLDVNVDEVGGDVEPVEPTEPAVEFKCPDVLGDVDGNVDPVER